MLTLCCLQDPHYTQEDLFKLKAENGIFLWSAAIDLRQKDGTGEQLPMEFVPENHCLMFHYTHKEAVEVSAKVQNRSY